MRNCIIPGSYDPVTAGHVELFKSACALFDKVNVVILANSEKKSGMFSSEERLRIMNAAIASMKHEGFTNIDCTVFSGLTTDAALELNAGFLVKGVRNISDFAYEYDLSQITKRFDPSLQSVFLPADADVACVSSTYVRELIKYGKFDSGDFARGTVDVIKSILSSCR